MIIALLPPSSKIVFPKRSATAVFNNLPILVEPVAETSGMRVSFDIHSPTSRPP